MPFIQLWELPILKETPKGKWIYTGRGDKWVPNGPNVRRKYAYDKIVDARMAFIKRKDWHYSHLQREILQAEYALRCVIEEWGLNDEIPNRETLSKVYEEEILRQKAEDFNGIFGN